MYTFMYVLDVLVYSNTPTETCRDKTWPYLQRPGPKTNVLLSYGPTVLCPMVLEFNFMSYVLESYVLWSYALWSCVLWSRVLCPGPMVLCPMVILSYVLWS